jgi:hypothetical protein
MLGRWNRREPPFACRTFLVVVFPDRGLFELCWVHSQVFVELKSPGISNVRKEVVMLFGPFLVCVVRLLEGGFDRSQEGGFKFNSRESPTQNPWLNLQRLVLADVLMSFDPLIHKPPPAKLTLSTIICFRGRMRTDCAGTALGLDPLKRLLTHNIDDSPTAIT